MYLHRATLTPIIAIIPSEQKMVCVKLCFILALFYLAKGLGNSHLKDRYFKKVESSDEPTPPEYSTLYIEQQLDHFNYAIPVPWKQRYLSSGKISNYNYTPSVFEHAITTQVLLL